MSTKVITTVAGGGTGGDGGPATSAGLLRGGRGGGRRPGQLLHRREHEEAYNTGTTFTEWDGTTGIITTVVGDDTPNVGGDGHAATAARLAFATGLAVGPGSTLYVTDYIGRVRRVDHATGEITTVAGGGHHRFQEMAVPPSGRC